jgi:alpha,alpha-trehalase
MMEKYNVLDVSLPAGGGEYALQDGFGWTNGVALAIQRIFEEQEMVEEMRK